MPIPTPGVQLVTLTHVEDVASMLAAVRGNKAAIGQHYNVCSDRAITFQGGRGEGGGQGNREAAAARALKRWLALRGRKARHERTGGGACQGLQLLAEHALWVIRNVAPVNRCWQCS